jgi:plastocyanin
MLPSIVVAFLAQSLTVSAATMMVTVAANNKFTFTPNTVTAQPGDMVAFNFVSQVGPCRFLNDKHRALTQYL